MTTKLHAVPGGPALRRRRPAATVLLAGGAVVVADADGRPVHRVVPDGGLLDGEVLSVDRVADVLRTLAREHRLPRRVRVAVADPRLITRVVRLPAALEGGELVAAARFAAADVLPIGADSLSVGVSRLGPAEDGSGEQRVLLAVARREAVERLQQALARARLVAERVEPAGSALARAAGPAATTLRVDIGAVTAVAVSEDGRCSFAHVAQDGTDGIERALVARLGMSDENARAWLDVVGAAGLDADVPGDPDVAREVRVLVRDGLGAIAAGVRNALAFHERSGEGARPTVVVLSGAAAHWPDLREVLGAELGLRVEVAPDPAAALLDGLRRDDADAVDLRLPGRVRAEARPLRTGRALPAAIAAVALVCGGLASAVHAHRGVGERERALAAVQADGARLAAEATALGPYGRIAAERDARERAARTVVARRLPWADVLDDLAAVAPAGVRLRAVRLTPGASGDRAGAANGTEAGVRAARDVPAVEVSGCAPSHPSVAGYLDALLRVRGVTTVALDRSRRDRTARSARTCAGRAVAFTAVAFLEDARKEAVR